MYIGDLEGTAQTVNKKFWRASVTIPVLAQGEIGLSRASVTGNWTGVYEGTSTCTTGASGTCGVTSGNIRVGTSSVTFNVNGVTAAGYVLDDTESSLEVTSR
jgi:serine protease AprX